MKRLHGRDLRRLGLQLGLLAGIGLAFVVGSRDRPAQAGGNLDCADENLCSFRRPNLMFILDYSTSMNTLWDAQNNLTRWDVAVATIEQVTQPGGFASQNTHLGLLRFGHDPNPAVVGSTIPGDGSGLVDGQALDVAWDDDNDEYIACAGASISAALEATPAPQMGAQMGIGSWTKGALDRAAAEIAQTKADHPEDQGERAYINVVLTDGVWTGVDGTTTQAPAAQDPVITAQELFDSQGIRSYVVAVAGDAQALAAADQLAAAGGTTEALDGGTPDELVDALTTVVGDIADRYIEPECAAGQPRVMVLLDATSSMLNVNGGIQAGSPGETGWDQAREALAGQISMFEVDVGVGEFADASRIGLAVFGHATPLPGEQKILVQYGPCLKDNFAWALDPSSSCELPGCEDPWGGPPISWTFKDGTDDPPGFLHPTQSHMPRCDGVSSFCMGSGTYTHLGLQLIKDNQAQYQLAGLDPTADDPTAPETLYVNILITDGQYSGYSTNAQVQTELEQMYDAGVTTYVVGFGDGVNTAQAVAQLETMAGWGSGGTADYYDANNQVELEQALANIVEGIAFDPCCAINDCAAGPEPTGGDEMALEPVPNPTTGDGDGDGDGDPTTTGDGDGDATGTGDGDPATGDGGDGDGDPSTGDGDPSTGDGESGDAEGVTESDTGPAIDVGDDGCNCRTSRDPGPLGAALALLLLGFVRRRDARATH